MIEILPEKLKNLARACPVPLYVVGGATRDFLAGLASPTRDLDLCAPMDAEAFVKVAEQKGFSARAVYKNTGTVKLQADGEDFEFTSFRSDEYIRGTHRPVAVYFTSDIGKDARRRDFKANAVYYDVASERFVDPLGGIEDIRARVLSTVDAPEKVFGEDGLRLLRLARQAGQTGFTPTPECLQGAIKNAGLIEDIAPERIYAELKQCLFADEKYQNERGHYEAICLLERTGVFAKIFPELSLGKGMTQRKDFHDYDILEHSLRAVLYAKKDVRLAALLHDVGKPICQIERGHVHEHPEIGEALTRQILQRLKAPIKTVDETCALVRFHMYDFDCKTKEGKLRRFFVDHAPILPQLLDLKQADFSACKDDESPCPTGEKWRKILADMKREGAPLTLRELAVKGSDLLPLNIPNPQISRVLKALLRHAVVFPEDNRKERLLFLATRL